MSMTSAVRLAPREAIGLTIFAGRAGDRNARAMQGAAILGAALAARLDVAATTIGTPAAPLGETWTRELEGARAELEALAQACEATFAAHARPVLVMGRCAASLATLPVPARHRPDACLVWFDAHADLNTPANTPTGYLGGLVIAAACGLWDSGLGAGLPLNNVVLAGTRDIDPGEQALIDAGRVAHVAPGADFAARLAAAVAGRPVYVHIDCDVLEPDLVPSEYRVPGGLSLADLQAAAGVLARLEVVGLELTEYEASWAQRDVAASPDALLDALAPLLLALRRPA